MAPPMPLTTLSGIIRLARSPAADTCTAPSTVVSIRPERITPKDAAEPKYAAPGRKTSGPAVTGAGLSRFAAPRTGSARSGFSGSAMSARAIRWCSSS